VTDHRISVSEGRRRNFELTIDKSHFYGHIEVSKDPQGVYDGVLEFVMVNQKQASRLTIKPLSDEPLE